MWCVLLCECGYCRMGCLTLGMLALPTDDTLPENIIVCGCGNTAYGERVGRAAWLKIVACHSEESV